MEIENKTVWIIMSKDRKVVAKGTPRNRCLILTADLKCKKRLLTYSSKGMAEAGFNNNWFYMYGLPLDSRDYKKEDLEAVEVKMTIQTLD